MLWYDLLQSVAPVGVSLGLDGYRRTEAGVPIVEAPAETHPGSTPGESTMVAQRDGRFGKVRKMFRKIFRKVSVLLHAILGRD